MWKFVIKGTQWSFHCKYFYSYNLLVGFSQKDTFRYCIPLRKQKLIKNINY